MSELLTTKEICDYLKVSRKTIYNWRDQGMPYIKQQGTVRYDKKEIEEWLKRSRWNEQQKKDLLDAINTYVSEAEKIILKHDSLNRLLNDSDLFDKNEEEKEIFLKEFNELKKYYDIQELKFLYDTAAYNRFLINNNKQKINYDLLFRLCRDFKDIFKYARQLKKKDGDADVSDKK